MTQFIPFRNKFEYSSNLAWATMQNCEWKTLDDFCQLRMYSLSVCLAIWLVSEPFEENSSLQLRKGLGYIFVVQEDEKANCIQWSP